jgi:hypothetical protein
VVQLADRAYRRWWKAHHPFTGTFPRVRTAGANYRRRKDDLGEVAGLLWEFAGEVGRAIEQAKER